MGPTKFAYEIRRLSDFPKENRGVVTRVRIIYDFIALSYIFEISSATFLTHCREIYRSQLYYPRYIIIIYISNFQPD